MLSFGKENMKLKLFYFLTANGFDYCPVKDVETYYHPSGHAIYLYPSGAWFHQYNEAVVMNGYLDVLDYVKTLPMCSRLRAFKATVLDLMWVMFILLFIISIVKAYLWFES